MLTQRFDGAASPRSGRHHVAHGKAVGQATTARVIEPRQGRHPANPGRRPTMSHTYTNILIHAPFSTKNRQPWLHAEVSNEMFSYLGGGGQRIGGAIPACQWPFGSCSHVVCSAADTLDCGHHGESESEFLRLGQKALGKPELLCLAKRLRRVQREQVSGGISKAIY